MRSPGGEAFNKHALGSVTAVGTGLASQAPLPTGSVIDNMHPLLLMLLINECH